MSGDINFGGDNKICWGRNTDSASISFKNDGDGDTDSYMSFVTSDNGNEYFRWSHSSGSTNTEWMALRSDGLRVGGTKVSLEGHSHNDLYYTKTEVNNKLNGKSNTSHTHDDRYLKLTGGTMSGTIYRNSGGATISGRDHAIIRQTYAPGGSSWNPIACVDTETGTWTLGHLSSGSNNTDFNFCFSTNADYNAGNNNGNYVTLRNKVGTIALLSDIPSSLKNPYSLNVFGVTYDGSAAKVVSPSNFISQVTEGTSTVTDGTMLITSYASNSGFADTNAINVPYKRKAIHLWEYIKAKTDSIYATKGHNHDDRYLKLIGGTLTGDLYINTNLYGPACGNNPRNRYDAALYFFNCNSSTTSTYNFGLYQWDNEFQFTYRTSADNKYKGNSFTIQGSDGQVTFAKTPKVGSALISLNGHTHAYLPLSGGTMTGIIRATNRGGSWISGRDHCLIRSDDKTSYSYWSAILAIATVNGYWTLGHLGDGGERIGFNYDTDADYNAGRNNNHVIWLPTGGAEGTLALTSDNVASATKLQTARSIWGHSFNGTADVNGTIYINNNNSSEGAIRLNNNINSNARISAIDSQVIFNTGNAIRFGETDWDWNKWAGFKYTHSNKTIYLGIADNSIFNANSAQSGGSLRFPGISNVYATTFNGSLSGNASTATTLQTTRTLWGQSFNGSNNVSGNMSGVGQISFSNLSGTNGRALLYQQMADNDFFRIYAGGTASNSGYVEIATADDGNEPIYVRQYTGVFSSVVRTLTLLDANGYTHFPSYINIGGNENNNSSPDRVWGSNGSDSYLRSYRTSALNVNYANSAGNADTVDGVHVNQLCRIYTFNVHNSIIKVGTLTSGQYGHVCKLRFNSGIGYNAWNQDKTMTVVIRASNGNANSNGFYFEAHSESYRGRAFTTFYLHQTSKTQCELYMSAFSYSGQSTYEVSFSAGDSWTNEISVQNALPTSNIFTLPNYQIAYTDYNVASATKLQTPRTIWGQSFDGTGNVNGTLRITQTPSGYCEGIRIQNGDNTWATIILGATGDSGTNANAWSIHRKDDNNFSISRNSADGTNGLVMTSVGMGLGTTAPTQRLDVHGNIRATGNSYATHFYESSDKTLKKNIKSILSSTNIPKIREFDWKDTEEHSYGFIAQELEEQGYGCLVNEVNGKKTVNYTATLALTVAKLQNLINIQNKKISNLTKELKALKYGRKKNS